MDSFNILGIDPGSQFLGTAIINVDIATLNINYSLAWTFKGDTLIKDNNWLAQLHGARYDRIFAHKLNLLDLMRYYSPLYIASESPFMNTRMPNAYGALLEVINAIKQAVIEFDAWRTLHLIPPSSVKNAVGAAGAANKGTMKDKISALKELNYRGDINLLDEHSIDALSVAYAQLYTLK